jgi:hypothetical protein
LIRYASTRIIAWIGSRTLNSSRPGRIVEIAQAILEERSGVIAGAREMMWFRLDMDPDQEDEDLLGMAGIESQTDHLPLGDVRLYWDAEALLIKDAEMAEQEAFFRDSAFACCRAIVERYARPASRIVEADG